ncbi:MAG: hypothetical protein WC622_12700 [Pedobacter sp.]|jgi:hypothetical protein|uniref:hypothetical protein n=1 Tax=Pedobacter sp. TaxID=1411316 RepID=UPI0035676C27
MGLFGACKKGTDPKPVDPIVDADPYKHYRPIEVASDDGLISKYSYNTANQIVKSDHFIKDNTGTKLTSSQTYSYTNGKLSQDLQEDGSVLKYISDYKYQVNTDIIESSIFRGVNYSDPAKPVTTSTINTDYSYVGGKISKVTTKDGNNIPLTIINYTFSLKGENPFVTKDYVPQSVNGIPANPPFFATTEYYKDVIDPISYFFTNSTSESKFITKSETFSVFPNADYSQTYELDNLGRIKTVSLTNLASKNTIKTTYTYEKY